jgi:Pretoxin HINT domain
LGRVELVRLADARNELGRTMFFSGGLEMCYRKLLRASFLFALCVSAFSTNAVLASEPNPKVPAAKANERAAWEALRLAAQSEIKGDLAGRERLLNEAIASNKNFAPALSQFGKIQVGKEWRDIDSALKAWNEHPSLAEYEQRRAQATNSIESHWSLAQWCSEHKLPAQERAHLRAILKLDPEHRVANVALGHVLSGGTWITTDELQAQQSQSESQQRSMKEYGKEMETIARLLCNLKSSKVAVGKSRLRAIQNPNAVLAAENVISPISHEAALTVIDWLDGVRGPESSMSLARHAVFHESEPIRLAAANSLSRRNPLEFAGPMIELLSYPIKSEVRPVFESDSMLGYRQSFFQEGMKEIQVAVVNTQTEDRRSPLAGSAVLAPNRSDRSTNELLTEGNLFGPTPATITERQTQVANQNRMIGQVNDRVFAALKIATSQTFPNEPRVWWNWYDSLAYVTRDGKRTRFYSSSERAPSSMAIVVSECFTAGTIVWTNRGPVKIETVQVGDLALSANLENGQLEFRPVVQTNRRPAATTVAIQAGADTLRCTRGHFFWVAGKGWTVAVDLTDADVLHAVRSPVKVDQVRQESEVETYNLEIEKTACYFVGQAKILTHDMTPHVPSSSVLPGVPFTLDQTIGK